MELDNLKELWQQQEPGMASENLSRLLAKKSKGPIAKMKRNLRIELIVVVVTYGLAILYFLTALAGQLNSLAWLYLFLAIVFIIYFARKNRLLNEMECVACQVKSNLSKQVVTLEKYIRFYLIAGTAIIPILALYSYFVLIPKIWFIHGNRNLPETSLTILTEMLVWLLATLALTVVCYFLNKWYVKKLYGNHIDKLKLMLEQMED
jgi:hypothetical protein